MKRSFTLIETLVVLCVLVVVALSMCVSVRKATVSQKCHDAGFPDVRFAGLFAPYGPTYCVKRVNQTDSVVALNKVR